jgi:hypothetical protein
MNEIIEAIKTVGFPIFVAVWLLMKDSKEKKQTREAISMLTIAINKLISNLRSNNLYKKDDFDND